jgi:hypothetical protein
MTDPDRLPAEPPPATPLDELASALLDGEATAEQEAQRDDPEVAARLAAFDEVRAGIAAPVTAVDAGRRDAAIAAALDAADELAAARSAQDAADELAARRHDRRASAKRWLGVAAAAVVVVGLGAALAGAPSDDSAEDAGSAVATEAGDGGGDAEQAGEELEPAEGGLDGAGGAGTSSPAEADEIPTIGSYDDVDLLLEAANQTRLAAPLSPGPEAAFDRAEGDRLRACAEADQLELGRVVALARLDGRDVVIATESSSTELRLVVVALDDCIVVARRAP